MAKQTGTVKQTTSFRQSEETQTKLEELTDLFRESGGAVIERAINYLYTNKEDVARQDLEDRLKSLKK